LYVYIIHKYITYCIYYIWIKCEIFFQIVLFKKYRWCLRSHYTLYFSHPRLYRKTPYRVRFCTVGDHKGRRGISRMLSERGVLNSRSAIYIYIHIYTHGNAVNGCIEYDGHVCVVQGERPEVTASRTLHLHPLGLAHPELGKWNSMARRLPIRFFLSFFRTRPFP